MFLLIFLQACAARLPTCKIANAHTNLRPRTQSPLQLFFKRLADPYKLASARTNHCRGWQARSSRRRCDELRQPPPSPHLLRYLNPKPCSCPGSRTATCSRGCATPRRGRADAAGGAAPTAARRQRAGLLYRDILKARQHIGGKMTEAVTCSARPCRHGPMQVTLSRLFLRCGQEAASMEAGDVRTWPTCASTTPPRQAAGHERVCSSSSIIDEF